MNLLYSNKGVQVDSKWDQKNLRKASYNQRTGKIQPQLNSILKGQKIPQETNWITSRQCEFKKSNQNGKDFKEVNKNDVESLGLQNGGLQQSSHTIIHRSEGNLVKRK